MSEKNTQNNTPKTVKIGDKEHKIVNSNTIMEIVSHQLDNGQEIQQVVAHEFMMADHKEYMVRALTDAINMVMKAQKMEPTIKLASQAVVNRLKRYHNQTKGAFGKRRK